MDADGNKITNLADPVNDSDAISLRASKNEFLEPGVNLFNPDFAEDGFYYSNSNGQKLAFGGSWSVFGLQKVEENTEYSAWKDGESLSSTYHFYDENENWLGSNSSLGIGTPITGGYKFTTPNNCAYVGFWIQRSTETFEQSKGLFQIELGDKTTYQPYQLKLKQSLAVVPSNVYTKT